MKYTDDSICSDNDFRFGGLELIQCAIDYAQEQLKKIYVDLLSNAPETDSERAEYQNMTEEQLKAVHYDKLLDHIRDYCDEWIGDFGLKPYNDNRDNPKLVSSWKYEHQFWDLIRLWKNFDPETEYAIYYGW